MVFISLEECQESLYYMISKERKGKERDTRKLGLNHFCCYHSMSATSCYLLSCWSKILQVVKSDLYNNVFYSQLHTVHKGAVPLS